MDVVRVLKEQLPMFFDGVESAPLTREHVMAIPERAKGAYLLLHQGHPVYAGKTDARHGFRDRLERHSDTIQHRIGLEPDDMTFKAVRVMVFSTFDVEAILIDEMRARGERQLTWNDSGFGSNDPGHNRERQEPADFDRMHPVDVDRELDVVPPGDYSAHQVLLLLKEKLPYLIRFETDLVPGQNGRMRPAAANVGHFEQRESRLTIPTGPITTRQAMSAIVAALPADQWQATIFPDRVILYRERVDYDFALSVIR
ncbi:MAG: Eco29kI family restriction endonuclease [Magnetospirillum sp. WYHS-4]